MQTFTKLDSDESVFFLRELEHIKSKSYDNKYASLKARSVIPVSFEAGSAAESITYEQWEQAGIAKIVANYGTDFPRADVKAKQFTSVIKSLGASYGYNVQEIRAAQSKGKPLNQRKANAARRSVAQQENSIAYVGDTDAGLQGWLTNANIPDVALAADGTGASTTLLSKTPDLQIRDLNLIANNVIENSLGIEEPDTMLLPLEIFTSLMSNPRSNNSDTTVLNYFLTNNAFIQDIDRLNELTAANGFIGSDTAIAYRRDADAFTLEIPQEYETFPPQEKGMEFVVNVHERIGGVILYYPLSQAKSDDV